jgi:hypothetical protein
VDAHPATCLDLRLVCRGTRSVGYRHTLHLIVSLLLVYLLPLSLHNASRWDLRENLVEGIGGGGDVGAEGLLVEVDSGA